MAISSENTSRILTRGESASFKVAFFADAAKTMPLIPINADYPRYEIFDLAGTSIQSGTGTMLTSGYYVAPFQVPKDAELSYFDQRPQMHNDVNQGLDLTAVHNGRYRIEWTILTAESHQVNFVEEFDVRDVAVTRSHSREQKYMVLAGKEFTLSFRVTELPAKASVSLFLRGNNEVAEVTASLDRTVLPEAGDLKYAKDGDSYVLYYDVPEGITKCNTAYTAIWEIKEKVFVPAYHEFQIITSVSQSVFPLITTLSMFIDKFQIKAGRIQAYESSDLLEYMAQGLREVNGKYPTTSYTISTVPDEILYYVTMAAAAYGLRAQAILNAQLNFNFSGQNVTLSVDNAAQIESVAQNIKTELNENLPAVKMAYVRSERGVGTVGTRGVGYNRANTMVYRVGSGNSPNMSNWLVKIGLL